MGEEEEAAFESKVVSGVWTAFFFKKIFSLTHSAQIKSVTGSNYRVLKMSSALIKKKPSGFFIFVENLFFFPEPFVLPYIVNFYVQRRRKNIYIYRL